MLVLRGEAMADERAGGAGRALHCSAEVDVALRHGIAALRFLVHSISYGRGQAGSYSVLQAPFTMVVIAVVPVLQSARCAS